MPDPSRDDLRRSLRQEELLDDAVVVVRGGPSTIAQLARHAGRTADAFDFDGEPLTGVSVFCALDDIGAASLDALLGRFSYYRVVYLPTAGRLRSAGFELLPTFKRPHYTVRLSSGRDSELEALADALGAAQPNPYHGPRRRGGGS